MIKLRTTHIWKPFDLALEVRRAGGWARLTRDQRAKLERARVRLEASGAEYAGEGDVYHASGCLATAQEIERGLATVEIKR